MRKTIEERFWEKVQILGPDDCWEWTASLTTKGYGQLCKDGKTQRAHRVAYALFVKDPGELQVLHTCDNPPCCNPRHLFIGTTQDNTADMRTKGRASSLFLCKGGSAIPAQIEGEIHAKYIAGVCTSELGKAYEVSRVTISRLLNKMGVSLGKPNAKLTLQNAREVRSRYAAGGILQRELAEELHVSVNTIENIIGHRTWREPVVKRVRRTRQTA